MVIIIFVHDPKQLHVCLCIHIIYLVEIQIFLSQYFETEVLKNPF